VSKHRGFRAGSGNCAGCHDPHGSDKPGLAPAFTHAPYAEGACDACHAGTTGLVAAGAALCVACHTEHEADAARAVPHKAVTDSTGCLNCHAPHGGKTEALLTRDDMGKTCFACHDRGAFAKSVKHPAEVGCDVCHDPHGSQTKGILAEAQVALCSGCHDDVAEIHAHPYQGPKKDPRTGEDLVCTSCHSPHSSEEEALLTHEKRRQLCVQCHLGPNLEVRGRYGR
jgi:predicted CXXCH cytochrome family protein